MALALALPRKSIKSNTSKHTKNPWYQDFSIPIVARTKSLKKILLRYYILI